MYDDNNPSHDAFDSQDNANDLKTPYAVMSSVLRRHATLRNALIGGAVALVVGLAVVAVPKIYADVATANLQSEINILQAQNDQSQAAVDSLLLDARNYQDAISKLQSQIDVLQQNIDTNKARQDELKQQITAKQIELDAQRKVLGEDIKALYVSGQLSTLEMLATSKNLNEFVDSATYHEKVQQSIHKTLKEVAKLQNQLQGQKYEVDILLASQRSQQAQLDESKGKQAELLALNQTQQAAFNQQIIANQDAIRELQLKQAALNQLGATRVSISGNEKGGDCDGGSGNGGYVLASGQAGDVCNAPKDSILDWAGIENRECTSYAYWYFKQVAGNKDFTASGDAKYWIETSNYPVNNWPKVGAIGVKTEGEWGHVTIVQAVGPANFKNVNVPAGKVLTSEMNSDFTGKFSYNLRDIASMRYIYK